MTPSSTAKKRLTQVSGHLTTAAEDQPLATRFRPALPPGLPVNYTPLNPLTFLLRAAQVRPRHTALTHPDKGLSWSYSEWATRVGQLAYALRARGVKAGDRVMIIGPNVPFVADALQAIPAVQGIIVALNIRINPADVSFMVENSGASLILVDKQFIDLVRDITVTPIVVCDDSGLASDPYEQLLLEGAAYDRDHGRKGWSGLEFQKDENATFAISYTSGTTSRPKGVETSYRGTYLAGVANGLESGLTADSVYLWILPMFHCLGWCYPFACTMAMATQVCLRAVGDYTEVWKGLLERGVTHYCGAPTVQLAIATHKMARTPPQKVRTTVAGAAPTSTLIKQIESHGIRIDHIYGLTETFGPMTMSYFLDPESPDYYTEKARQGHSFRMADDIRVVRLLPEGEEHKVPEGGLQETRTDSAEVGEIVMRGNLVMKGYWKDPVATTKAFAGGYFHSGDLAVRRDDGTFAIQDRSKDIIISGAENISSLAIESALSAHPDVHEVACIARPHEKWGERPHAYVVLKDGAKWHGRHAEFEKELKQFSRGKMPGFAIPEWVEVISELEKTSTGKLDDYARPSGDATLLYGLRLPSPPNPLTPPGFPAFNMLRGDGDHVTALTDPDGQYKMRLLIEDGIKPRALGTPVNAPPAIKYKPAQVYTSAKLAAKGRTAAAYVESLEGKRFQIEFEDCRPYRHVDLAVRLYVDGQHADGRVLKRHSSKKIALLRGFPVDETTLRPFLFSKLSLTDDDDRATTDEKIVRGMGSISLRVYRVKVTGPSLATSTSVTASRKPDFVPAVLHESSKKAQISHQTGFGHAEKDRPKSRVNYDRIDPRKTPCFTLGLHYRSRTILEFEGIVEAAPVPRPNSLTAAAAGPSNSKSKKRSSDQVIVIDSDSDGDDDHAKNESKAAKVRRLEAELKAAKADMKPKIKSEPTADKAGKKVIIVVD